MANVPKIVWLTTEDGQRLPFEGRPAELLVAFALELAKNREAVARQHVGKFEIDLTQNKIIVRRSETSAPYHFTTDPAA